MTHFEEHTYAFVKGGVVTNVAIYEDHDDEKMALLAKAFKVDEAVDCCANGQAYVGGTWDGTRFWPAKPYDSWVWDETSDYWAAPVAYPEGDKPYYWDEDTVSWKPVPTPKG